MLLIERALAGTAALWPAVEQGFVIVHAAARLLANPAGERGSKVRRRFDGLLAAMQRHRHRIGELGAALDHFRKVACSDRPGLFHAADVADLPRTNNALEQLFGSQRYHERRATGRKTASPGAVLRGAVRLVAASVHGRKLCPGAISARLIRHTGVTCVDLLSAGGRLAPHAPASAAIPTPTSPPSNDRPNIQLCCRRKKAVRSPSMRLYCSTHLIPTTFATKQLTLQLQGEAPTE